MLTIRQAAAAALLTLTVAAGAAACSGDDDGPVAQPGDVSAEDTSVPVEWQDAAVEDAAVEALQSAGVKGSRTELVAVARNICVDAEGGDYAYLYSRAEARTGVLGNGLAQAVAGSLSAMCPPGAQPAADDATSTTEDVVEVEVG